MKNKVLKSFRKKLNPLQDQVDASNPKGLKREGGASRPVPSMEIMYTINLLSSIINPTPSAV